MKIRHKRYNFILIAFLCVVTICVSNYTLLAQKYPAISYLKKISTIADSVTIATIYSYSKENEEETLSYKDTTAKPTVPYYVIQSSRLTHKEILKFNSKLNHFQNQIALPNHSDIEIRYYIKDSIYSTVIISSITRNISIVNHSDCDPKEDMWDNYHNTTCIFRDKISKSMEKYLTKLLQTKGLWNKSETFFKW